MIASLKTATPLVGLVALVGMGVAGYNTLTTGCPLGSCSTGAAVAPAATEDDCGSCCPLGTSVDVAAAAAESTESCSTDASCSTDQVCPVTGKVMKAENAEQCATECATECEKSCETECSEAKDAAEQPA